MPAGAADALPGPERGLNQVFRIAALAAALAFACSLLFPHVPVQRGAAPRGR